MAQSSSLINQLYANYEANLFIATCTFLRLKAQLEDSYTYFYNETNYSLEDAMTVKGHIAEEN